MMHVFRHLTLIVLCLALVALSGCQRVKEERKHRLLEHATSSYRQAIRWGYYEAALQSIAPDQRPKQPAAALANIRVTGYEVIQAPVILDEEQAEQLVRIEYVLRDRQRVESLADRQTWQYDQATSRWWLNSGLPAFPEQH
jgi:hypothetical protein